MTGVFRRTCSRALQIGRINPAATLMECNQQYSTRVVASAGVFDAFRVLACRQELGTAAAGDLDACATRLEAGRRTGERRSGFARTRSGADGEAEPDHRSDVAGGRNVDGRGQSGYSTLQIGSAHPDRWTRERFPAAERGAQRGADRT